MLHFEKLVTLVPLSRPDPDPREITERVAQAVLTSYQALWHPAILRRSSTLPAWTSVSNLPIPSPGQLILVPEASCRLIPDGWLDRARTSGATTIAGESTRQRFVARLLEELPADLVRGVQVDASDFFALGLAQLWLGMLTAYMKHGSIMDEDNLLKEVLAAAAAAMVGDVEAREDHLRAAFQTLMEARERVYGAEVHLIDLCLLDPRAGMDRLGPQLGCGHAVNLFASGSAIEQLQRRDKVVADQVRQAIDEGRADLAGGEFDEVASTLLPLESHLWQFRRGERSYRTVLGRTPVIYGRRRFGLARHVLQLLNRHEFLFFTHFCFDEGVMPPHAEPKGRWEAPDSSTVEGFARVPLAADNALSFLTFPSALAKTMNGDFVATVSLVHWPMPDVPWYADLVRIARFANVFGRFSTLSHYFQSTDPPATSCSIANDRYVSPFLAHGHRNGRRRPISEFPERHRSRARFQVICWLEAVLQALRGPPPPDTASLERLESAVELDQPDHNDRLGVAQESALARMAELIGAHRPASTPGLLLLNPLCLARQAIVTFPPHGDAAFGARPDAASTDSPPLSRVFSVPAMGFAWVAGEDTPAADSLDRRVVFVDDQAILNELVHVQLDSTTGGVRSMRDVVSRIPQIGQQLVLVGIAPGQDYSLDASPGIDDTANGGYAKQPSKSEMRATSFSVRSAGPELAEVVVEGELHARPCPTWATSSCMARFRQTYRLVRSEPLLRVRVEILDLALGAVDSHADPWRSYLASRFAWPDPRSLMVRGVGTLAEQTQAPRPESPYFVEIHGRRHRTAIVTGGLPFLQRVGERMLDVLLITATEQCRMFEFAIGVDLPNPFHAALDLVTPVTTIPCDGPPPGGPTGWFFHLDARNLVITSVSPLGPARSGVRLRLFESAGRYTRARLRCPRNVAEARMTDFHGQRLATLEAVGDALNLDLAPDEITQIEIEFTA